MPKNLEISGTSRRQVEAGERFVGLLSGDLHVQRVGTQIELVAPNQFARGADLHLAKLGSIIPQGENALADQGGDIGKACHAIGKLQAQLFVAPRTGRRNLRCERSFLPISYLRSVPINSSRLLTIC